MSYKAHVIHLVIPGKVAYDLRLAAPVVHRVALKLASREHGLDKPTSSQAEGLGKPAQRKPPTAQQTCSPEPATVDAAKPLQARGNWDQAPGARSERTQQPPDGGARQPAQRKPATAQQASGPEPATVRRDQIAPGAREPGPSSLINGHHHHSRQETTQVEYKTHGTPDIKRHPHCAGRRHDRRAR
jgi:hypothetical protein